MQFTYFFAPWAPKHASSKIGLEMEPQVVVRMNVVFICRAMAAMAHGREYLCLHLVSVPSMASAAYCNSD